MRNDKIKVLFFIDSFRIGGMHRQVLYIVKHIDKDVFEPIMCTSSPNGGLREDFEKVGCRLIDLGWKRTLDFTVIFKLIRVLYMVDPNVVFISEAQNLFYFRIARMFWIRKVIQIGSFRALTFWKGHLNNFYQRIDILFSKWLYLTSDCVIVNSCALKNHYSSIIKINSLKPIQVIYNGSDFDFSVTKSIGTIRNELGLTLDEFVIVMIARLDPWKDFETFLEAAKIVIEKNSKVRFLIVGDGELRHYIEALIMDLCLESNVKLLYEKKDVFNYLNASDISVLSTNGEGFSNSILESMAMSKPVIATNVGGNSEMLGANEFGILVAPKSSSELADAIIELMSNNTRRNELAIAGKDKIYKLCNIDKLISSYEDIFLKSTKK
jgi:glycosyltransferase involved in cell wall biosynthesis